MKLFLSHATVENIKGLVNNKKKVATIGTSIVLLAVLFYTFSLQNKINALMKANKDHAVKLNVLTDSAVISNRDLEAEHEQVVDLKNRVEIVANRSSDYHDEGLFLLTPSPTEVVSQSSQAHSESNPITPTITSVVPKTAQGSVEVYDPQSKMIPVYKDASTISAIISHVENGTVVSFSKKTSGWYQVILDQEQMVWIPEKNIRVFYK